MQDRWKEIDIGRGGGGAGNSRNQGGVLVSHSCSLSVSLCLIQIEIIWGGGGVDSTPFDGLVVNDDYWVKKDSY